MPGSIGDYTISDDESVYIIPDIISFDNDDDDYGYIMLSQCTTNNFQIKLSLNYNIYNHNEFHLSSSGYLTDRSLVEINGREPYTINFSIKTDNLNVLKILNIAYINNYECLLYEIFDKSNKKIYSIGGTDIEFNKFIITKLKINDEVGKKNIYIADFTLTETE